MSDAVGEPAHIHYEDDPDACTESCDEPFSYHDRVVGRLGETGTVIGAYDDGSVLVKLDAAPQSRLRYMPIDLRPATDDRRTQ